MSTANDTSFSFASISTLADALRRRQVSSVELTTLSLERLERLGPSLGALVHLMRPTALAQAKAADKELAREIGGGRARSPLLGIPYGVKDLLATKDAPTEWGSPAHQGQHFPYDAFVVRKLADAGAVLVGKLSMVELAGGPSYRYASASATGPGRTPWNPGHWSGGSSSGPGAATAAGLVGFSIGSETWGSIVCPSSFCGVSGLRPTFGRVSRQGAMALSWTMDKIGPLARTAEDCGLVLQAIAGADAADPTTAGTPAFAMSSKPRSVKGLKLGVVRPDYHKGETATQKAQPETETAFAAALGVLEKQGATLSDAVLPDLPTDEAASLIVQAEAAAAFDELTRDPARLSKLADMEQQGGLLAGLVIPAADYLRALRLREVARRDSQTLWEKHDALVSPGYLQVAPPVEASLDDYFVGSDARLSGLGNLIGLPALCVPMGFGPGHLPLGLQFVGAANTESTLLALGMAFQSVTNWHTQRPPAPFG